MKQVDLPESYLRHKGLIVNLLSFATFFGIDAQLGSRGVNNLDQEWGLALFFVLVFLLEPWATYYSMGVFNARREQANIEPIWLHRWLRAGFLAVLFWGGRFALLGVLFAMSLQSLHIPDIFQHQTIALLIWLLLGIREGFVVYYMASKTPHPEFKKHYDLLADLILIPMLAFGQLAVAEIFRDLGIKGLSDPMDWLRYAFPILLFLFIFYLPIRYLYTLEELTFAQSRRQKAEAILGISLIWAGFLWLA